MLIFCQKSLSPRTSHKFPCFSPLIPSFFSPSPLSSLRTAYFALLFSSFFNYSKRLFCPPAFFLFYSMASVIAKGHFWHLVRKLFHTRCRYFCFSLTASMCRFKWYFLEAAYPVFTEIVADILMHCIHVPIQASHICKSTATLCMDMLANLFFYYVFTLCSRVLQFPLEPLCTVYSLEGISIEYLIFGNTFITLFLHIFIHELSLKIGKCLTISIIPSYFALRLWCIHIFFKIFHSTHVGIEKPYAFRAGWNRSFRILTHNFYICFWQSYFSWTVSTCLFNSSFREVAYPHSWQTWYLIFSCTALMCLLKESFLRAT